MTKLLFLCCFVLFGRICWATSFDQYNPDKTGKTDVSGPLDMALKDAAGSDKRLVISPGRYLVASPVILPGHVSIVAPDGGVQLNGTPENDIFQVRRNHGNCLEDISFSNCKRAIAAVGDGYFAVAYVRRCSFANCGAGVDASPVQLVSFVDCSFSSCGYGIRGGKGYGGRSNGVYIYHTVFSRISDWAIEIEGSPTHIMDCDFEGCDGGGIALFDSMVSTIEGCYFEGMSKERNNDILVGNRRLSTRLVIVRGNQFNGVHSQRRIIVTNDNGAHIYDNFAYLKKGQILVDYAPENKNVRVENNSIENEGDIPPQLPKDEKGKEK